MPHARPLKSRPAALAALVAAVLLVAALLQAALFLGRPAGPARSVIVRVYPGTSLSGVSELLEARGVVSSAWKFQWLARLSGKGSRLKAGEYDLNPGMTPGEVLDMLAQGKVRAVLLTIPEGYSMYQVAAALESAGLVSAKGFLGGCRDKTLVKALGVEGDTLEGYLFPDTYNIAFYMSDEAIARMMVKRFLGVWRRYAGEAKAQGRSMREVITLASIVEKETGLPSERPLISAVFHNRLRQGMRLQSDPTVIYGLDHDTYDGNLTRAHLLTPTPYNTYCLTGLPAGPIASPGEEAIKAALSPARCDYVYFVSKNDGSHQFSATLEEHNRAVASFQKNRAARLAARAKAAAQKASAKSEPAR